MDLCRSAEVFLGEEHGLAAQVLLVTVRRVVVAHAREPVPGAEALELLGTDIAVDIAEVSIVSRPHQYVQVQRKE